MSRRSFLSKAAVAAAVVVAAGVAGWRLFPSRKQALAFPSMLSGFCDEAALRDVGRRYLARFPGEASTSVLLARLAADGARRRAASSDALEAVSEAESLAEQDFVRQQILVIDGWIISRTEARQCALLALS